HAPYPEKRIDLAILDRIHRFRDPQALDLDVFLGVDADCLEHAPRHHLRAATRGTRRDALSLEIGKLGDAGAVDGHDVHAVRIEHDQRARVDLATLEFILA